MYLAAVFLKNPFAGVFGKNTVRIYLLMLFVSPAWADFHRLCWRECQMAQYMSM